MSSFINFNNKEVTTGNSYTAEAVKIALLKSETKSPLKATELTKNIKEPLSLNEALVFFTDKMLAMKSLSSAIIEINEGKIKQFEADYKDMENNIKKGIGWIDPDYVGDTWENSSDAIDYSLIKGEILKRLANAGLLWHTDKNGEDKGKQVKFSELGAYAMQESLEANKVNENLFYAFFNNKKIEVEGKDLWDAKQKAIIELKVPKSKIGYLAVVSAESQKNQDFKFESEEIVEAYGKPAGLTLADTKKVAELYANALSKADGVKATVNKKSLEEDSFDLDVDGEEYAGGSYNIYHSGEVVNHAVPGSPSYGYFDDKLDTIVKNIKNPKLHENVIPESIVNEASRKSIKKYKGLTYLTYYEAPKGYSVNGIGELSGVVGSPEFFETEKEAQEYAEEQIKDYLGESLEVTEASMSDIDLDAQDATDFKSFVKQFKKDYPTLVVGDLKELELWLQSIYDSAKENMDESKVNEHNFKVGDKVKMAHGGTGVIKSLDKESGADDEKYYNVELPSGEIHKHAPNELTKESVVNEGRSINKIQKEWSETTTKMQQKAGDWKVAEGDRKSELLDEMKALTAKKRQLEAELDAAVAGKDKDLELVVSESNISEASYTINSSAISRMNGLVNTKQLKSLLDCAEPIIESMVDEGFELEDTVGYIAYKIANEFDGVYEGNAFGAARAKAIADGAKEFKFEGETYKVEDVGPDDKENAKDFVEESKLTWESLIEKFTETTNEDIRSDVKKFIKDNASELNILADKDEWDMMYTKLYNEFNVEADSTKGKDLLKTFQFIF